MADDNGDLAVPDEDGAGLLATIGGWLSGIPKAFQRPMAKAAGRLLFGLVNVPASALDAKAEDIKHAQQMKKKVRAAVIAQAIGHLPERPDLADRALEHFVTDLIGKQQNREAVLHHTIVDLSQSTLEGPNKTPEDLDEDWLNAFSRHAENASSERLRELFGRILAGEIRNTGSYSLFTLDFLAKLGQRDADIIVQIAPYVIENCIILTPATRAIVNFMVSSTLGALNIATATSIGISSATRTVETKKDIIPAMGKPSAILSTPRHVFIITTDESKEISFDCILLTHVGSEVLNLHVCDPDSQMLREFAQHLKSQDAELHKADLVARGAGTITWRNQLSVEPAPREAT